MPGLAPVGRLDKASAGLLLLTNDAATADRLLDPRGHVAKSYRVKVRGKVAPDALAALRHDSLDEDGLVLGPMQVEVEREGPRSQWLTITLREGKNRQIRRRLEALGHEVEVLVRTAFGPLALGDLAPGAVRELEPAELEALERAARPWDAEGGAGGHALAPARAARSRRARPVRPANHRRRSHAGSP